MLLVEPLEQYLLDTLLYDYFYVVKSSIKYCFVLPLTNSCKIILKEQQSYIFNKT